MVKIVKLPPERWEALKKIRLEALKTDPTAYSSSFEEELELPDEQWHARINRVFFAEIDATPVGMIRYDIETNRKTLHIAGIYSLFVSKGYRNQGTGNLLMTSVLLKIKENKEICKIKLTVNPSQESAVRLYTRHGFTPVGLCKNELDIEGTFYDEMIMEKYL